MPRRTDLFKIRIIGRCPDHPRFVIRDARRVAERFWKGNGWSRSVRDARIFADPEDVARTIGRLTRRHLRRHQPKELFTLTLMVKVHANESVSRQDVERYLRDALVVGVDHDRCGNGPTPGSLVEVSVPVISLDDGGR